MNNHQKKKNQTKIPTLSFIIDASHYFETDSLFSRIVYAPFQKHRLGNWSPSYCSSEFKSKKEHKVTWERLNQEAPVSLSICPIYPTRDNEMRQKGYSEK